MGVYQIFKICFHTERNKYLHAESLAKENALGLWKRRTILLHGNGENTQKKAEKIKNKYLIFEFWTCLDMEEKLKKHVMVPIRLLTWGFWHHLLFPNNRHTYNTIQIMSLAMVNGVLTSIFLETLILVKQMTIRLAR